MKKLIFILILLSVAIPVVAYDDVTPVDAFYLASGTPNIYILDVRTSGEWTWVGHPGLNKSGEGYALEGKVVNASFMIDNMNELVENPEFIESVEILFPDKVNVTLITMCRSGGRSIAAAEALEAAGYLNVMNMLTGFEGGKDADGYRTVDGWKNDGLPYNNSNLGAYVVESQCPDVPEEPVKPEDDFDFREKFKSKIKIKIQEFLNKHDSYKYSERSSEKYHYRH